MCTCKHICVRALEERTFPNPPRSDAGSGTGGLPRPLRSRSFPRNAPNLSAAPLLYSARPRGSSRVLQGRLTLGDMLRRHASSQRGARLCLLWVRPEFAGRAAGGAGLRGLGIGKAVFVCACLFCFLVLSCLWVALWTTPPAAAEACFSEAVRGCAAPVLKTEKVGVLRGQTRPRHARL